ncbi:MAG: hypothetical protein WKF78_02125 [Candidatus Limnocylindrales bacterium]
MRSSSWSSLVNALAVPGYLQPQNQINLVQLSVEKAIVVLAMTFVIVSGEIDLSVASVMGLAAVTRGLAVRRGGRRCRWRSSCALAGRGPVRPVQWASGSRSSGCRHWP